MINGNSPEYDRIIPVLDIRYGDRIFEIGYGPGLGVDRISSNYDCFIAGIDFSELMFKEASKRNKKHIKNNKAELNFGDFLTTEIIPNQYDKVFCLNVIYFWDRLDKPFSKIITLLKVGGILCIFMVHRDYLSKFKFTKDGIFNKYTIDNVVDQLGKAGFEDISYHLENDGYIIKCRKR
jgi:SAM-dependent methyltransferase